MRMSKELSSGRQLVIEVAEDQTDCGRKLLSQLATRADSVAVGEAVEVDACCTTVRLRSGKHEVVVEEPDYAQDPSRFIASLSVTCLISDSQQRLLHELGVNEDHVAASQYLEVSQEAMRSVSVVGYRREDQEEPFTGWQIVATTGAAAEDSWGMYSVRELAAHRLVWIVPLVLPVGWSFRCVGNTLVDCVSPARQTHPLNISIDI